MEIIMSLLVLIEDQVARIDTSEMTRFDATRVRRVQRAIKEALVSWEEDRD